jgi:hypothetical protein
MNYQPEGPESSRALRPEDASPKAKEQTELYGRVENIKAELEHLGTMNLYPLEYERREAALQVKLKKLREEISSIEAQQKLSP